MHAITIFHLLDINYDINYEVNYDFHRIIYYGIIVDYTALPPDIKEIESVNYKSPIKQKNFI